MWLCIQIYVFTIINLISDYSICFRKIHVIGVAYMYCTSCRFLSIHIFFAFFGTALVLLLILEWRRARVYLMIEIAYHMGYSETTRFSHFFFFCFVCCFFLFFLLMLCFRSDIGETYARTYMQFISRMQK